MRVVDPIIFSIEGYAPLAAAIAAHGAHALGEVERRRFPDGERYDRIVTPVAQRHVVAVGGTVDDAATLELYDLASGLVAAGAESLTLVVPYFGYATMERAVKRGEVVKAKTRARLLSAIPAASLGNRVLLVDLHADGITHYFEGGVRAVHVYAKPLVLAAARASFARAEAQGRGAVLACTDAGRAKWVESLASELGVPAAFVYKRRLDGSTTTITGVSAEVEGRHVVVYDDMIRTGGSLVAAARAYRAAGAASVDALTTHAVLPDDALARLVDTGLFGAIVATDSHPRARALEGPAPQVHSLAPLLGEALRA